MNYISMTERSRQERLARTMNSRHHSMQARREARAAVNRPGKFQGQHPMVPILYDMISNNDYDEHCPVCGTILVGRWALRFDDKVVKGEPLSGSADAYKVFEHKHDVCFEGSEVVCS